MEPSNASFPPVHPMNQDPFNTTVETARRSAERETGRIPLPNQPPRPPNWMQSPSTPPDQTQRYDVDAQITGRPSEPRMFYDPATSAVVLRCVDGELRTVLLVVPEGEVTVGRALECGHCIIEQSVSRLHATFRLDPNGLTVRDENSVHGVVVNGKRLPYARLHDKDIVELGNVMLQIEIVPRSALALTPRVRYPGDHLRPAAAK